MESFDLLSKIRHSVPPPVIFKALELKHIELAKNLSLARVRILIEFHRELGTSSSCTFLTIFFECNELIERNEGKEKEKVSTIKQNIC